MAFAIAKSLNFDLNNNKPKSELFALRAPRTSIGKTSLKGSIFLEFLIDLSNMADELLPSNTENVTHTHTHSIYVPFFAIS